MGSNPTTSTSQLRQKISKATCGKQRTRVGDIMIKVLLIVFLISVVLSVLIVLGGNLVVDLTYEDDYE